MFANVISLVLSAPWRQPQKNGKSLALESDRWFLISALSHDVDVNDLPLTSSGQFCYM